MWKHRHTTILTLCVIVVLCIAVAVYIGYRVDGFQTTGTTELNVNFLPNEVFLVVPPDTNDYSKAYNAQEAAKVCSSYKSTVATNEQLQTAIGLGAKWCLAGWLSDGTAASVQDRTCGASAPASATPQKVVSTGATAYATCWGVKPQQFTELSMVPFNASRYNMVSNALLQQVITGVDATGNKMDIFPGTIVPSQAYYALQETKYNAIDARKYLIANYKTINSTITTAVTSASGATPITGDWLNMNRTEAQSCNHLIAMYNNFALQLTCLRSNFQDVSGGVLTAMKMKQESGGMQGIVAAACAKETPASSPACARLAQLDYSTYLGKDAKTIITDLKGLNYNLSLREQEIQQAILTLQRLMGIIGCTMPSNAATQQTCPGTTTTVSVSTDILGTGPAEGGQEFTVGNKIGYNSVESLKFSLQNISPYFSSAAYKAITDQALQALSTYLIVPPVSTYSDAVSNIKGASVYFEDINKKMPFVK